MELVKEQIKERGYKSIASGTHTLYLGTNKTRKSGERMDERRSRKIPATCTG